MNEVSLVLKNRIEVSIEEFKLLDRYAYEGRILTLIYRPSGIPFIVRNKIVEYVLSEESLTAFCLVSDNILATWNTEITRSLQPGQEFQIAEAFFIQPRIY